MTKKRSSPAKKGKPSSQDPANETAETANTQSATAAPTSTKSEEDAIKDAMVQLQARVEEIKGSSDRFSPASFSPEKLYEWINTNISNFKLPVVDELSEKLKSTSAEDFRNPETWQEIWVIVSQSIQQELSQAMSKADELASPAISSAQDRLDGLPTLGETKEQINAMSAVKSTRQFVEQLPGYKEGVELLNSVPGAATINSLTDAIDKTAPKDLLDTKTWEGFWQVVNHSLSKEIQTISGRGKAEEEIIQISEE